MNGIDGNITASIQVVTELEKNAISERIEQWETVQTLKGWLDMSGGSSNYTAYNAKVQESTHVFISDFVPLDSRIKAETSRMIINGKRYDVTLIDNPMELNEQLEIYLTYTGGR